MKWFKKWSAYVGYEAGGDDDEGSTTVLASEAGLTTLLVGGFTLLAGLETLLMLTGLEV